MGRPIGSVNKAKPFTDMLRVVERRWPSPAHHRREIGWDGGGGRPIGHQRKEVGDRLDGKCAQVIARGDVSVEVLSDRELFAIIRGGINDQSVDLIGGACR
jgi:hypothetical protein